MAEVVGIVTGVLGLLPLCRSGIGMILDVLDVSESVKEYQGRVRLQQDQFLTWAEIWDTPTHETPKFERYAKEHPNAAGRVLYQLGILSRTLFNAQQLQKYNGLKPKREHKTLDEPTKGLILPVIKKWEDLSGKSAQESFKEKCKLNMSFIRRCQFVVKNEGANWTHLIELLKEYMVNLRTFGPEPDLARVLKAQFNFLNHLPPDQLQQIAQAAGYEAQHSTIEERRSAPYHKIEQAAKFRVAVRSDDTKRTLPVFPLSDFIINDGYSLSTAHASTMALLFDFPSQNQRRIVLIEWILSRDEVERDIYNDIKIKANMLRTTKPTQLLLPDCYGVVEELFPLKRYGLVLVPPLHIRTNLPATIPRGLISQQRKPVTLRELILQASSQRPVIDLGTRFRLAKKLVDAVHMMHCVGWVHKNIRPDSILFFPEESKGRPLDESQAAESLAYDEPMFVGFGNARPDKITETTNGYYDDVGRTRARNNIRLDFYQHPAKQDDPGVRYSRSFDIYSLGCVLLEIAQWRLLEDRPDKNASGERFKRNLQECAKGSEGLVGSIYAQIVYKCLSVKTYNSIEADTKELSSFCTEIAAELDKCVA